MIVTSGIQGSGSFNYETFSHSELFTGRRRSGGTCRKAGLFQL